MIVRILVGHVIDRLRELPPESVHGMFAEIAAE